jgi:hypothetical protein
MGLDSQAVAVRDNLGDASVASLTVHDPRFAERDEGERSHGDARVDSARDEDLPPRRNPPWESEVRAQPRDKVPVPRSAAQVEVLRPVGVPILDGPRVGVVLGDEDDLEGISFRSDRGADRLELRLVPPNDVSATVEREEQVERRCC